MRAYPSFAIGRISPIAKSRVEFADYAQRVLSLENCGDGSVYGTPITNSSNVDNSLSECLAVFIASTITPGCRCEECNDRKDMMKSAIRMSESEVKTIVTEKFGSYKKLPNGKTTQWKKNYSV